MSVDKSMQPIQFRCTPPCLGEAIDQFAIDHDFVANVSRGTVVRAIVVKTLIAEGYLAINEFGQISPSQERLFA